MTIGQRVGALVVAAFAIAFTRTPWLIRLMNPVMKQVLKTPLPAGPNALLTVRGRKSGRPRTSPVSFLDLGDHGLLQAASHEVGWVANLRANGEATIRRGSQSRRYHATELSPEAAGEMIHDLLARFPQSRLVRKVVGPLDRPPVGVLYAFRLRVDGALLDYVASARRQPVFELRLPR